MKPPRVQRLDLGWNGRRDPWPWVRVFYIPHLKLQGLGPVERSLRDLRGCLFGGYQAHWEADTAEMWVCVPAPYEGRRPKSDKARLAGQLAALSTTRFRKMLGVDRFAVLLDPEAELALFEADKMIREDLGLFSQPPA